MSFLCCGSSAAPPAPPADSHLTENEFSALHARFRKITGGAPMTFDRFKTALGLLGSLENEELPRRMFSAFDEDQDGRLTASEFSKGLGIMLKGSEDERLELSFKFFDKAGTGNINWEDFLSVLSALHAVSQSLVGAKFNLGETSEIPNSVNSHELRNVWQELIAGERTLSLEAFKRAVRTNRNFQASLGLAVPLEKSPRDLNLIEAELLKAADGVDESLLQERVRVLIKDIGLARERRVEPPMSPPSRLPSATAPSPAAHPRRVILGPKHGLAVHFGHENWNMVLSMMIGLRMATSRSEPVRAVAAPDFEYKDKFSILPQMGNFLDSELSQKIHAVRFVDYAPHVFRALRAQVGLSTSSYLKSIGPEQLLGNLLLGNLSSLAELTTEGKSGAFFYFTADGKFLIKTVTKSEQKIIKKLLPAYFRYLQKNPDSLLLRFYGLHALREKRRGNIPGNIFSNPEPLYFVVMGNLFGSAEPLQQFDLKGSYVGRWASEGDSTGKDNDFLKSGQKVALNSGMRARVLRQLEKDSDFLQAHGILDYSLLLGISDTFPNTESVDDAVSPTGPNAHGSRLTNLESWEGNLSYRLGVIDFLTVFNTYKKGELIFKYILSDGNGVSVAPPKGYADRFMKFMREKVFEEIIEPKTETEDGNLTDIRFNSSIAPGPSEDLRISDEEIKGSVPPIIEDEDKQSQYVDN